MNETSNTEGFGNFVRAAVIIAFLAWKFLPPLNPDRGRDEILQRAVQRQTADAELILSDPIPLAPELSVDWSAR